jgi:hypothetical protein
MICNNYCRMFGIQIYCIGGSWEVVKQTEVTNSKFTQILLLNSVQYLYVVHCFRHLTIFPAVYGLGRLVFALLAEFWLNLMPTFDWMSFSVQELTNPAFLLHRIDVIWCHLVYRNSQTLLSYCADLMSFSVQELTNPAFLLHRLDVIWCHLVYRNSQTMLSYCTDMMSFSVQELTNHAFLLHRLDVIWCHLVYRNSQTLISYCTDFQTRNLLLFWWRQIYSRKASSHTSKKYNLSHGLAGWGQV